MNMKRVAKRTLMVLFVFSIAAAFARPGLAAPRTKMSAEEHYQKGMKAYTLGKFPEAIEEFEKAYELRSEPIFLYNIAQSHRQNNSPQRAIFFYRRYLEAEPEAKNRGDIEQRIKDMQTQLNAKSENATPVAAAPAPQPVVVAPAPAPQPVVVAPVSVLQAQPAPAPSSGRGLRIAGIAVGAVGVAGVVTGVVLGLQATSLHDDAVKAGSVYDDSKFQSAKTYRTMAWASLGVGAAAIATGGVLYYLGATSSSAGQPVTVVPVVAPGMGGAAIAATF
jgi:tetratricopeptide (TPR) repeat protein